MLSAFFLPVLPGCLQMPSLGSAASEGPKKIYDRGETVSADRRQNKPVYSTAVAGTERILEFAALRGTRKLLYTSSGAVYGPQPRDLERLSEEYQGPPALDDPSAGYAEGKRSGESLCAAGATSHLEVKIGGLEGKGRRHGGP